MMPRSVVLAVMTIAVAAVVAHAQVFEDGATHTVNGRSEGVEVHDSSEGLQTTVLIVAPADVQPFFSFDARAVIASALHGGRARVDISGGDLGALVLAQDGGVIRVSGGTLTSGAFAISADGAIAHLAVTSGTITDRVAASGDAADINLSGGVFLRGPESDPWLGTSIDADDGGFAHVSGGLFEHGIGVFGGELVTTGGEIDHRPEGLVAQVSGFEGNGIFRARGGTFAGEGFFYNGSRARISGGQWSVRSGVRDAYASIIAVGTEDQPSIVEIFGGRFERVVSSGSSTLRAATNSTIHVYLLEDEVMGPGCFPCPILADGTPLIARLESTGGDVVRHYPTRETAEIPAGFDLTVTAHGAVLDVDPDGQGPGRSMTIDFVGVPLGAADFGGNVGIRGVGIADMIIRRNGVQTPKQKPFLATTPIEVVALQLASKNPIDLRTFGKSGRDRVFLTLQSDRQPNESQGKPSRGVRDVDFAMREFDATLELNFDLRSGSLKGPIIYSGRQTLQSPFLIPWSPDPPRDSVEISGVNSGFFAGAMAGVAARIALQSDEGFSIATSSATTPWLEPMIALAQPKLNLKSNGVIALTVLGSKTFDISSLDPRHTGLGPTAALEAHAKVHVQDVNGDGYQDAVMHFAVQDIGLTDLHHRVCLRGHTRQDSRFRSCTAVQIK